MRRHDDSGLTLPEIIVVVAIVGFLALLSFPISGGCLCKGMETQTLSNMKQLHLASQQMVLDGETYKDTNLGWPGDRRSSFAIWAFDVVGGNYLYTNDLCKLLSAEGKVTPSGRIPVVNDNAVLLYAVSTNSPSDAVFLSTANFTNTPTGGVMPTPNSVPYGQKGFVVFHKAGDGVILANRQTGTNYTNIIGGYVPLCR